LSLSTILGSTSASAATAASIATTATSAATATTSIGEVNLFLNDALEAEKLGTGAGGNSVHISASYLVLSGNDSEFRGGIIENLLLGVLDVLTSSCFLHQLVLSVLGLVISKVDAGEGLLVFLGSLFLFFALASLGVSLLLVFGLGLFLAFLLLGLGTFDLSFLGNGSLSLTILGVTVATFSVTALSLHLLADFA